MGSEAIDALLDREARRLVAALAARSATLSTAESLTAGMVSSAVAGVPGASAVLRGGAVTYVNEVKERVLGVSARSIAEHTEVSHEVAREMAAGSRRLFGSDVAVSLTGYAAYDALLAEIADLRRSGASDVQTDFSHDLLSVNDYYQTPGWLLRDLDGDGTSELLLGADWGDGYGVIFNIYRLDGAQAVRVVDGWSRSRYFLCSDGTLAHEWSGGADHWGRTYLRYGETLLPVESVFDRGGVWYHAKGLDALSLDDTQLEDRCKTIPRAEAEQLMERYTKQYEALPFTPFKA